MGRALYCPWPGCSVEYYTYCAKHRAIREAVEKVAEHLDPENILSRSIVYANLQPMIKQMEEQHILIYQLTRQVEHLEAEARREHGHA